MGDLGGQIDGLWLRLFFFFGFQIRLLCVPKLSSFSQNQSPRHFSPKQLSFVVIFEEKVISRDQ
jgi:hypothetical protein